MTDKELRARVPDLPKPEGSLLLLGEVIWKREGPDWRALDNQAYESVQAMASGVTLAERTL